MILNTGANSMVYAWEDNEHWMLSRFKAVVCGRRPIAVFDSREDLELEANRRGLDIEWLA